MPIVGNLSEFPLPEVLLLIGIRTGRLRLLDVPEFGVLDIDISEGEVQNMHIGSDAFNDSAKMLDKLSAIVQMKSGMFEFRLMPVSLVPLTQPLSIHVLAIKLVCHVDEQTARQAAMGPSVEQRHRLVTPQPEIWVEPELNQFFHTAHTELTTGVSLESLAQQLGMDPGLVYKHLNHLRLLGLTELLDGEITVPAKDDASPDEDLTTAFHRTAQIKERIRKLSAG